MIRAGNLCHRVILQTVQTSQNEYGEAIEQWTDSAPFWAKVMHQKGDESFVAAQTDATITIKVLMRYRPGVKTTHRVKWNDDLYDIHDVDETLRHKGQLWIMARAHNA